MAGGVPHANDVGIRETDREYDGGVAITKENLFIICLVISLILLSGAYAETFSATFPEGCIGCSPGIEQAKTEVNSILLPAGKIELTVDTTVSPRYLMSYVIGPTDFTYRTEDQVTKEVKGYENSPGDLIEEKRTPEGIGIDGQPQTVHRVTTLDLPNPLQLEVSIPPSIWRHGGGPADQMGQTKEITITWKPLDETSTNPVDPTLYIESRTEYINDIDKKPGVLTQLSAWKHGINGNELVPYTIIAVTAIEEGNQGNPMTTSVTTEDNGYVFFRWIFEENEKGKSWILHFSPDPNDPYAPGSTTATVSSYIPEDLSAFSPERTIFDAYPGESVCNWNGCYTPLAFPGSYQVDDDSHLVDDSAPVGSYRNPVPETSGEVPEGSIWNDNPAPLFMPGASWIVKEYGKSGSWDGEWVVRDDGKTIDASWSGGQITDIIDIQSIEGDQIVLFRHGNSGYYTGTISVDGLTIEGTASWKPGELWEVSLSPDSD